MLLLNTFIVKLPNQSSEGEGRDREKQGILSTIVFNKNALMEIIIKISAPLKQKLYTVESSLKK